MFTDIIADIKELKSDYKNVKEFGIVTPIEMYSDIINLAFKLSQIKNYQNKDYICLVNDLNEIFNNQIKYDLNKIQNERFDEVKIAYVKLLQELDEKYNKTLNKFNIGIISQTIH